MVYSHELIIFIISAFITLSLGLTVWKRNQKGLEKTFLIVIFLAFIWTVVYIIELSATSIELKIFTTKIQSICAAFIPLPIFAMILDYNEPGKFKKIGKYLFIIPTFTSLILWLAPLPNWYWGEPKLVYGVSSLVLLDYDYGFWYYYVHVSFIYLIIIAAIVCLINYFIKMQLIYRSQIISMAIALFLPALAGIFYVVDNSPGQYINYTPAAFGVSCLIFFWALFRYKFMDLLPKARDMIFENMEDGIIVLDSKKRIIDLNHSASQIIDIALSDYGKPILLKNNEISNKISEMLREGVNQSEKRIIQDDSNDERVLDISIKKIIEKNKKADGSIITIRDYTEKAMMFDKILNQSMRDELTGIHNRRYMIEQGQKEISRMKRNKGEHMSVAVIDLDDMKITNDLYGHKTGDKLLIEFSELCLKEIRPSDIFARIGGDEFALILTNTNMDIGVRILVRIIESTKNKVIMSNSGDIIPLVVSVGLVNSENFDESDVEIEKMIENADRLMYEAKGQGGGKLVY